MTNLTLNVFAVFDVSSKYRDLSAFFKLTNESLKCLVLLCLFFHFIVKLEDRGTRDGAAKTSCKEKDITQKECYSLPDYIKGISKNSILTFSNWRRTKVEVEKEGFLEMPLINKSFTLINLRMIINGFFNNENINQNNVTF